eukprot:m.694431 g.694431  ORF g.694431 m.694431 type:complete len:129 (+) comp58664_c0_seq4:76-462(+)
MLDDDDSYQFPQHVSASSVYEVPAAAFLPALSEDAKSRYQTPGAVEEIATRSAYQTPGGVERASMSGYQNLDAFGQPQGREYQIPERLERTTAGEYEIPQLHPQTSQYQTVLPFTVCFAGWPHDDKTP